MPKLTLDDLKRLRDAKRREMRQRDAAQSAIKIVIGMGTCGIAAGAKETFDVFLDELARNNVTDAVVQQTGCMGLCYSEPTVEVSVPGMPTVVYGKVDAETARKIVRKHIVGKLLINDHIHDKPAGDILKRAE